MITNRRTTNGIGSPAAIINIVLSMGKELSMKAICKDNSHLFRSCLTIGKEYEVIEVFDDQYAHYLMFNILSDNGEIMPYRANRFDVIKE